MVGGGGWLSGLFFLKKRERGLIPHSRSNRGLNSNHSTQCNIINLFISAVILAFCLDYSRLKVHVQRGLVELRCARLRDVGGTESVQRLRRR